VCPPSVLDTKSPWMCVNWASWSVNSAISHLVDGSATARWEIGNSMVRLMHPWEALHPYNRISELLGVDNSNSMFRLGWTIRTIGRWIAQWMYLCCGIGGETFQATSPRFP
jgi:hypothetical protein